MTTIRNPEGRDLSFTSVLFKPILLQLNASNKYYTTGEHNIIFSKTGSNNLLLLDFTHPVDRNVVQYYTIHDNTINSYGL